MFSFKRTLVYLLFHQTYFNEIKNIHGRVKKEILNYKENPKEIEDYLKVACKQIVLDFNWYWLVFMFWDFINWEIVFESRTDKLGAFYFIISTHLIIRKRSDSFDTVFNKIERSWTVRYTLYRKVKSEMVSLLGNKLFYIWM